MPVPEGWDWINDMPPDWEIPLDLQGPTRYAEANLAIKLLSCEILGSEVQVALGGFLAEFGLFTMWFGDEVKGSGRSMERTTELMMVPQDQTRRVYEAWKNFDAIEGANAPDDVLRSRRLAAERAIVDSLRAAAATLAATRREEPES